MSSLSGANLETDSPETTGPSRHRELELLHKAQTGDRPAYGQLVLAYQDRLFNAILRVVGDREEARDLTQEAFMRGLASLDSFRGEASPYTWLFRISLNLAISRLRKVQRKRVFSLSAASTGGSGDDQASGLLERLVSQSVPDPALAAENRERDEQVLAALGRLDAEYRAVLVMRDIEGFDYQEMAEVLGLPMGTLKSRLFRARLALRDELQEYLGGNGR